MGFYPTSIPPPTLRKAEVQRRGSRSVQLQKILEDLTAALGENALGMELHSPNRKLPMLHAHDFALLSFSGDLEAFRQGFPLNHERMIPGGRKGIWHAFEQVLPIMLNQ